MPQTPHDIRDNIVQITDSRNNFYGTAFFIHKQYCITCHHCIPDEDEIYIRRGNQKFAVDWIEEYSDMSKDVAILRVKEPKYKPLECAKQLLPGLSIFIWGFSSARIKHFPDGECIESTLFDTDMHLVWDEKQKISRRKWGRKRQVDINVYKLGGKIDVGFSGAPVSYHVGNKVVGMLTAKDEDFGYVIPIEEILEKFDSHKERLSSFPSQVASSLDLGNEFFQNERYEMAMLYYDKVIKDMNNVSAWTNKGKCLSNIGHNYEAIQCFNKALEINPYEETAWNNKGFSLYEIGDLEEALKCYEKAIEINPNYAYAWTGKGEIMYEKGKFDEAIQCFSKAIEITPNYSKAWTFQGMTYYFLNNHEKAKNCFLKATEIPSNTSSTWNSKGVAYYYLGKYADNEKNHDEAKRMYEESEKSYANSLAINAIDVRALNNRGVVLDYLGRYEDAIKSFDHAIRLNYNSPRPWSNRGLVLYHLKKYEEALINIEKSLEINKNNNTDAFSYKGFILHKLNKHIDALNSIEKALESNPHLVDTWNEKCEILGDLGHKEAAEECFRKAREVGNTYTTGGRPIDGKKQSA